jgi:quercetin dioxygenase-like cupin family protein
MPIHHALLGKLPTTTERIFSALATPELGTTACSVHENVLNPGAVVPWHAHAVEEVIVCLDGQGECRFGDGPPQVYEAGSVVIIPAGVVHTLRNAGLGRLRQLAVLAGPEPATHWVDGEGSVGR